jgi:superfamily II DNA helicase RecQ
METFALLVEHLPKLQIIICRPCAVAVPPAQLVTHIKERHPKVSVAERKDVAAIAHALPDLAWSPKDVRVPKLPREPISGLQSHSDAFICTSQRCLYVCTTLRRIRAHCTDEHGWVNNQKRGGDVKQKSKQPSNRLWRDGQSCQRLFKAAGWPAYIVVEATVSESGMEDLSQRVKADRQHQREERKVAAAEDAIKEGVRVHADPWVELTEWVPHLKGVSRAALLRAREPACGDGEGEDVEEDMGLDDACKAMQRLIRKAFSSCRAEIVGRLTLEIIERREVGAESNERPFYSKQRVRTIKKYSQKLVSILCYLWRTNDQTERPPYKLTSTQDAMLWSLQQMARSDDPAKKEELEEQCLRLWIALLDHTLPGDEHESGLLSGVAVLGLKPNHHGGGWVPAHEFSSTLSALITTSKALVVHDARCKRDVARQTNPETAPTAYELVRDMAERFMTLSDYRGMPSPINRMLRLRTLARSYASQRNTPGMVSWDRDRLLVDKQSFSLADLRSMIKGLCETVRLQLLRDVLLLELDETDSVRPGTTMLPELFMDKLVDQPAELATGWNFLKHPDNQLDQWQDWLLDRVSEEAPLRERFIGGIDSMRQPPRILWRDDAVARYMKRVRRFKEGLFTLVHLSAGAPARGTEITSIQCENGAEGIGYRGVFVEGGLVSFTTTYHKGYSFSKRVKTIHRYVPREVSELVVYFLGLGRPFIDDLQMLHNGVPCPTAFVWEPEPEEQWEDESGSEESNDGEDDDDDDNRQRTRPANPDGYWGTDRVRRVLREQTFQYMSAALGTRAWRHAYPAIHRELAKDGQAREWLEVLYWNKEPTTSNARALQSGHSLQTEEGKYGRSMMESPFQTMAEREAFRRVSMDWHRVLEFASAWENGCMHPGVRAEMIAQQGKQALQRWSTLAMVDLKAEFRRLAGRPDAEYRGKQEEGLRAVMQRRLRVLVVMATGTGKSMLFMLPASVSPGGITIVVAPLNALQDDLQDRCDELGIPCAKWDGRRPPYWASIVLVTPESAVTKAFGRFMDEKRMLHQLDRIVIDECHVLLESTKDWRPDILKMTEMTEKGTQVLYLTATLPPTLQPAFLQTAGLDARTVTICRDERTTRTNIAYQVLEYARGALHEVLVELVAAKRRKYGPGAQIIVYCLTVDETKRLAKLLRCPAYYREMNTDEEKARMVRNFTAGIEKLCTATNMLGLGLNAVGVRVVIHVSMRFLLLQYVQESGRAGRTGLDCESVVLRACWQTKGKKVEKALGYKLEQPAKEFLTTESCRRIAIDKHMDGRQDRQQCEVGESKCDLCEKHPSGTKRQAMREEREETEELEELEETTVAAEAEEERRELERAIAIEERRIEIQQRRKTEQVVYELERLEHHFQRWSNACAICMAVRADPAQHSWKTCSEANKAQIKAMEEKVRFVHRVKWEKYTRCLYCLAPQAICNKWEETSIQGAFKSRGMHVPCQYDGVLQGAVAALLTFQQLACTPWLEQQMQKAAIINSSNEERLCKWLGQKVKIGQRDASFMCCFLYAWEEGQVYACM